MKGAPDGDMVTAAVPRSVGEALRRRRETLGLELSDVAAALRIKPRHLAALEAGCPDQLPGPAYTLGFLRAFADYLGLDANEVLRRFKQGPPGLGAKPDLSFPIALDDRSMPGGGALLVAAILAFCGYGTWYYLSTGQGSRLERVAPVPAELLPRTVASLTAETSAASSPSGNTPRLTYPAGAGSDSASPSLAPAAPPLPAAPATVQPTKGIILRATADSWIEIRDARHSVLVARVLKAGETYRVPDQRGLSMRTGNAGGLEITCDGNRVPPIGRSGMIRREIALDPQTLISGGAVRN